jgi:hypothetical protein
VLGDLDARAARIPPEAEARIDAIRAAVDRGVLDLTAAARRAAEETQAIDAAFQERVRRNYEILSGAMRLMGRVADVARPPEPMAPVIKPAAPVIKAPPEPAPEAQRAAMPELRTAAAGGADRSIRVSLNPEATAARAGTAQPAEVLRPAALSDPYGDILAPEPGPSRRSEPVNAAAAGLRPRLKLTTPAAAEEPVAPRARAPAPDDDWTWKELLVSKDEPEADDDDDALAGRLIAEIEALGVDAAALLPRPRIDEIAAALQTGDASGAREVVRRLAPAAVRRLSRRVLTDKVLRTEADRYVRRYEEILSDSAQRDREGYMTAALLGSDPGRAFLLLDAAVGDLH